MTAPLRALVPLVLLLAACADAPPPREADPAGSAPAAAQPAGRPGELRLKADLDGVAHRAVLLREGPAWRLQELEPAPRGALEPGDLTWIFCGLPASADLRLPDGRVLGHPDRALLSELVHRASGPDADLEGVLAEQHRLLRFESRAQLFTRLASAEPLGGREVDRLIEFASAGPGDGLFRPDPSGAGPGGDAPDALGAALSALADRLDLNRVRSDRVARAAAQVGHDGPVRDLLERLIANGRASAGAVAETALVALADPTQRGAVLLQLARKRSDPLELTTLCRSAERIGNEGAERTLLLELVTRGAPAPALVEATRRALVTPASRHAVLVALARRESSLVGLRLVGEVTPEIGQEGLEADVLEALAARPGTWQVVLAAMERGIETPAGRRRVLLALAAGPPEPAKAETVAARVPSIGHEGHEGEVLLALIRAGAPVDHVLQAMRRALTTPAAKAAVLGALVERVELTRAEQDLVARAVPEVGQEPLEERLLVGLAGKGTASTAVLLATAEAGLRGLPARRAVLRALARREALSTPDADQVAAAAPRLLDGDGAVEVLLQLVGRAPPAALEGAAEDLREAADRARVRAALSRGS